MAQNTKRRDQNNSLVNTSTATPTVVNTGTGGMVSMANTGTGGGIGPVQRGSLPPPQQRNQQPAAPLNFAEVAGLSERELEQSRRASQASGVGGHLGALARGIGGALMDSYQSAVNNTADFMYDFDEGFNGPYSERKPTPASTTPTAPNQPATPPGPSAPVGNGMPDVSRTALQMASDQAAMYRNQQPQQTTNSESGIYYGMVDGVPTFSGERFAGSQPWTGGGLQNPNSAGNQQARDSFRNYNPTGYEAIAADARRANMPQTRAPRMAQPQFNAQMRAMRDELGVISEMITKGIGPNGRPLTADGMQAMVGRANALNNSMNDIYGEDVGLYSDMLGNQNDLDQQAMANQGRLAATDLAGQYGLAEQDASGVANWNNARANAVYDEMGRARAPVIAAPEQPDWENPQDVARYQREQSAANSARYLLSQHGYQVAPAIEAAQAKLRELGVTDLNQEFDEETAAALDTPENQALMSGLMKLYELEGTQRYAQGGLVQNYAQGGLVGAMPTPELGSPPGMDITSIQNYQKYVNMARQMGVDPIKFEEFSQLAAPQQHGQLPGMPEMQPNAQAAPKVFGMADGGMVPDAGALDMLAGGNQVDGKMVVDPDPNAPTDSIPATIDGAQPAALDSGEFVLPKDVVMYYGTEKLAKLIEKARGSGISAASQEPQNV